MRFQEARSADRDAFARLADVSLLLAGPRGQVPAGKALMHVGGQSVDVPAFAIEGAYVCKVRSAQVFAPNILVAGGRYLDVGNGHTVTELAQHAIPGWQHRRISPDSMQFSFVREERLTGTWAYLAALPNYSSWLLGELPRIEHYRAQASDLQFILHGEARPFHWESLAHYGVPRESVRVVDQETRIEADEVLYCAPTYIHHAIAPSAVNFLQAGHRVSPGRGHRKVYLTRSSEKLTDRRIVNERELEEVLREKNFEIVAPESLTHAEQVQLFSGERSLLAVPFGAALANLVYGRQTLSVLMIATKFTPEFARIMSVKNLPFTVVPSAAFRLPGKSGSLSQTHAFVVDIPAIRGEVERMENLGSRPVRDGEQYH